LDHHLKNQKNQAIYSVIHGGTNLELRKESIEYLCSLPFDGIGVGGLTFKFKFLKEVLVKIEKNYTLSFNTFTRLYQKINQIIY
jgi:tRNA-guanine family transglycosylase